MGNSQKPARAEATITGELRRTPGIVWCPAKRTDIARADIGGFTVVASGDNAKFLTQCTPGTYLVVTAKLVRHNWKTGEGKQRDALTLEAEKIRT